MTDSPTGAPPADASPVPPEGLTDGECRDPDCGFDLGLIRANLKVRAWDSDVLMTHRRFAHAARHFIATIDSFTAQVESLTTERDEATERERTALRRAETWGKNYAAAERDLSAEIAIRIAAESERDKARGVVEAARAVVRSIPPPIDLKGVPLHDLDVAIGTFDAKPTDSEGER